TEIYTLSLHDALPISVAGTVRRGGSRPGSEDQRDQYGGPDRDRPRLHHLLQVHPPFWREVFEGGDGALMACPLGDTSSPSLQGAKDAVEEAEEPQEFEE